MLGMVEDPVCGMEINIEAAPESTEFRGQTYYFHSLECKEAFEEDPERYIFIEEEDT
jgi:YHS domain-containing protein